MSVALCQAEPGARILEFPLSALWSITLLLMLRPSRRLGTTRLHPLACSLARFEPAVAELVIALSVP
jgi:hypothetical protein